MEKKRAESRYVLPSDLQVGLYVRLELDWTSHPFSFSNFKISDEAQLQTLQSLGLERVLCDPTRSDPQAVALMAVSQEIPAAPRAPINAANSPQPEADASPAPNPALEAALSAKRERVQRLLRQRELMDECEKQFLSSARAVSNIGKNVFATPEASVERALSFVTSLVDSLEQFGEVHIHLMNNKLNTREVYDHNLNVTSLSLVLGQRMGFTHEELAQLGMACLFHDLGKGEIPEKVSRKMGTLSGLERDLMQMHVDHSVAICRKLNLQPEALTVIAQHHELADGSGYPKGLKGESIHKLARVVSLVNGFENLCNPSNALTGATPHDALKVLFARERKRHDPQTLSAFIRALGVYPPGTLVRLNNGLVGVVLSVNAASSLKPTVMVFENGLARSEALILDLGDEPDITVDKSVLRDELSADAAAYLNPRRRVSYFPGNG